MDVLVLSDAHIRAVLTAADVVATQDHAFLLAADQERVRSAHTHHATFAPDGMAFVHSAAVQDETGVVIKSGTQHPGNAALGLPAVQATVTLHDPGTGAPVAVLNGATITALRTAGGLVSAARALALPGPHTVGVLGAGVQAAEFVRLMCELMPVERVLVWSPRLHSGERHLDRRPFGPEASSPGGRAAGPPVEVAASPADLCARSSVIATCTLSRTPVVEGAWLRPGTTVLTMGSYAPDRRELDLDCARRAHLTFTDLPAQALRANGPILEAVEAGVLTPDELRPLAGVLRGDDPGRTGDDQILIFHGNGLGVQDAVLAWRARTRARAAGMGTMVVL
ncbi:ornithine cyclodeaminase family protein [Nonomuraea sp. NPDC050451]|uniref:ornithine cyclodeaminase family protein n=1 Tax=Nonomuraea sp. NPDC050451 TaxID=3364364 RepID=UPI00379CBABE